MLNQKKVFEDKSYARVSVGRWGWPECGEAGRMSVGRWGWGLAECGESSI